MLEEAKEGDVDDTEEESSEHEVICIQKKYLYLYKFSIELYN